MSELGMAVTGIEGSDVYVGVWMVDIELSKLNTDRFYVDSISQDVVTEWIMKTPTSPISD